MREAGWEGQARNPNYPNFEVAMIDEDVAVGLTTLIVDPFVRTAESILVLDPARRGEGLATEATWATVEVAFCVASLEMVGQGARSETLLCNAAGSGDREWIWADGGVATTAWGCCSSSIMR